MLHRQAAHYWISIHALLAESDRTCAGIICRAPGFLSTLSLRRATRACTRLRCRRCDFYPRSPCGERLLFTGFVIVCGDFYPRSPCGERPTNRRPIFYCQTISIHALLAESDDTRRSVKVELNNFYPRSPCGERPQKRKINPAS